VTDPPDARPVPDPPLGLVVGPHEGCGVMRRASVAVCTTVAVLDVLASVSAVRVLTWLVVLVGAVVVVNLQPYLVRWWDRRHGRYEMPTRVLTWPVCQALFRHYWEPIGWQQVKLVDQARVRAILVARAERRRRYFGVRPAPAGARRASVARGASAARIAAATEASPRATAAATSNQATADDSPSSGDRTALAPAISR
jgi:hypothetical protein